jgi:hypothetical protein
MLAVREDLTSKTGTEELYLSSMWQPEALEAVLAELFDNRLILDVGNHYHIINQPYELLSP